MSITTLFNSLRNDGLPLTTQHYEKLVKAIAFGFGLENRDRLYHICCLLWTRSPEEKQLLKKYFDIYFPLPVLTKLTPHDSLEKKRLDEKLLREDDREKRPEERDDSQDIIKITNEPDSIEKSEEIGAIALKDNPKITTVIPQNTKKEAHYLPASLAQMRQACLELNLVQTQGLPTEFNEIETIANISKNGINFDIIFTPRSAPGLNLLLLLDWGGSMVPFHYLGEQLHQALTTSGQFKTIDLYYFHNHANKYLFRDKKRDYAIDFAKVLRQQQHQPTVALIFSDAGAAKHKPNPKRAYQCQQLIKRLSAHVKAVAWVNPLPQNRWDNLAPRN